MHIRKRGNPYARKILYRAILNIISVSQYQPTLISANYNEKSNPLSPTGLRKLPSPQ
ncbi:transposase [Lacticaseibacillus casei UW4]|nr:transposase [Lacticaseibacillus casei UW4]